MAGTRRGDSRTSASRSGTRRTTSRRRAAAEKPWGMLVPFPRNGDADSLDGFSKTIFSLIDSTHFSDILSVDVI